jgi:hypothetical protein
MLLLSYCVKIPFWGLLEFLETAVPYPTRIPSLLASGILENSSIRIAGGNTSLGEHSNTRKPLASNGVNKSIS